LVALCLDSLESRFPLGERQRIVSSVSLKRSICARRGIFFACTVCRA